MRRFCCGGCWAPETSRSAVSARREELVEQAGQESFDGLILSPTLKNCELPELIGELRRVSGRRDLAAVVISSSFPDELRNELQMLDRVFLLNVPVNFALLSRILRESAGARKEDAGILR